MRRGHAFSPPPAFRLFPQLFGAEQAGEQRVACDPVVKEVLGRTMVFCPCRGFLLFTHPQRVAFSPDEQPG